MDKSKYKKHINVSLQNKKYYDSINPVLLRWAANNENMSEKVSESILMAVRLESSIGINKLMNTFEMIEKTLQIYFPEKNTTYNEAVEKAFEKIVNVNGAMLSDFITNPVQFSEVQLQSSQKQKQEPTDSFTTDSITEHKPVEKPEVIEESKVEIEQEFKKSEKEETVIDRSETPQTVDETPKEVTTGDVPEEKLENDTEASTSKESKEDEKLEQKKLPEESEDDNKKEENEVEITDDDVSLLFGK
ncbi:hypothetical protein [Bacillus sp. NPDC094106]|uniref:hypothetical protein n=1 Tax=Bacillus sp. NPDC094106 TaxID=3363949 RepID=UPI003822FBA4